MRKLFALLSLLPAAAGAQSPDSSKTLDAVVITATKHPLKSSATGKVVIVIDRAAIERSGARDLSQILQEAGGLYINGANSNPGKDKNLYLRGSRTDHTLIAIDGVPLYDASGIGGAYDLRNLSPDNIERIEILKGSQSTLYGSDAIAGVVNIITRKGTGKNPAGYALISGGSYGTLRTAAGVFGIYKGLDYNVGHANFLTHGISEAQRPDTSAQRFDRDGFRQGATEVSLGFRPIPQWRVQPYLRYTRNRGEYDGGSFTDSRIAVYRSENSQYGVRNEVIIGKASVVAQYQYNKTSRDFTDDFGDNGYEAGEHFGEAFVSLPVWRYLRLTGGVDLRRSKMESISNSPFIKPIGDDTANHRQLGIYASGLFQYKAFSFEAGARGNDHSVYGNNTVFNLNPSYLIDNRVKLFFNYSTGFRAPSLYQLFSEYGNRALAPEHSRHLEGGVQYFSKDAKSSGRITYFSRRVEDIMAFVFNPVTFAAAYANRDEQRDRGFEVDAQMSISDKVSIRAFYSYAEGEIDTRVAGKDTTVFNLYRRPRSTVNLSTSFQATPSLSLTLQAQSFSRSTDVFFPPPTFAQQEVKLHDYVLLHLYAEYKLIGGKALLFTDLRNLTNQRYSEIYGFAAPRFNAYGGLRLRF